MTNNLVWLLLAAAAVAAGQESFFGTWEGDDGPWQGFTFTLGPERVGIGPGKCGKLPYRVIEPYSSDEHNRYLSIEVDAPRKNCRSVGQEQVIFLLRLSLDGATKLHVQECSSFEDLKLLRAGKNNICGGEAHLSPRTTAK